MSNKASRDQRNRTGLCRAEESESLPKHVRQYGAEEEVARTGDMRESAEVK